MDGKQFPAEEMSSAEFERSVCPDRWGDTQIHELGGAAETSLRLEEMRIGSKFRKLRICVGSWGHWLGSWNS